MRQQIREQLRQGRSEQQINDFFEQRYGAFVRYDPPFMAVDLAAVARALRAAGGGLRGDVAHRVGGMAAREPAPLTPAERERAASLAGGRRAVTILWLAVVALLVLALLFVVPPLLRARRRRVR